MADEHDEEDDRALLRLWRDGDEAAGSRLLRRHFASLYRFFAPRAGSAAADLIQRTMLACVEARDRLDEDLELRAFLFGIARNQLLMHQRKQQRGERAYRRNAAAVPDDPSPSGLAARREEHRRLLRALRRLSLDDQILIEMYYWEGLGLKDVAAVVDVDPAAIKSRLHRARARLKETFDGLDPDSGASSMIALESWARDIRNFVVPPPR